jgi:hypothetical protein
MMGKTEKILNVLASFLIRFGWIVLIMTCMIQFNGIKELQEKLKGEEIENANLRLSLGKRGYVIINLDRKHTVVMSVYDKR